MLKPLAARLGPDSVAGEPGNVEILRGRLEETEGRFGDTAVLEGARRRVEAGSGTPAEQRTAVEIVAAQADAAGFEALLARAAGSADPLEKQHLFRALAGVSDPALARRMLDIALGDQIPAGTGPALIARLAGWHPDLVWEALAPRLDEAQLPFSKSMRWEIAGGVAGMSAQPQRIADLEAYEARSVPPEARKPFLESVASIRQNRRIVDDVLPELDQWIGAHSRTPLSTAGAP
jgi:aminopeptidase N